MIKVLKSADVIRTYGKDLGNRYLISATYVKEHDPELLHLNLQEASGIAMELGKPFAVVGGTSELDIPTFLREPIDHINPEENRVRRLFPELFRVGEVEYDEKGHVITRQISRARNEEGKLVPKEVIIKYDCV